MKDDPMIVEAAEIRAKLMIEKAEAEGAPLEVEPEFVLEFFLRVERATASDYQTSPPAVREAMVALALKRIASRERHP